MWLANNRSANDTAERLSDATKAANDNWTKIGYVIWRSFETLHEGVTYSGQQE